MGRNNTEPLKYDVIYFYLPAIEEKPCFVSAAVLFGKTMNLWAKPAICRAIPRMQWPAALLEMFKESPIRRWMAPVARYSKQRSTWIKRGRGLLRLVGCARFGRKTD